MCLGCYIRWGYIMYQLYAQACSTDFFEFIKHIKHFSFYKSDLHTFRMFRIWIKSLQVINRVTVNISLLQVHILWYKRMVSVYYEYLLLSSILTCVCMYSQWLHINILHVHAHQVFLTNFKYLQHAWSSSPEFSVPTLGIICLIKRSVFSCNEKLRAPWHVFLFQWSFKKPSFAWPLSVHHFASLSQISNLF